MVISGKEYVFLVDTGAPPTALSTIVIGEAGLKVKSKGKIGDSQSNDATIGTITLQKLLLSSQRWTDRWN